MTGNMRQARDPDTGWSFCFFDPRAKIEIFERPWPKSTVFPRGYICNSINLVFLPYVFNSIEREVGNHFSAERMAALDDPDSPDFESTFEFIKAPIIRKEVRRKNVKLPLRRAVTDPGCSDPCTRSTSTLGGEVSYYARTYTIPYQSA
ncbi:uncharacterized protein LOC120429089 isoform X2 [Culex pipiens pallens]|uniref:uncharacterized protein LOC120429089 isoform X2 n=1 Tax=Culex pipiens pallens TaxID=42434 RepID=UPI0022AA9E3D|nr:uncharacterized protein LOC120429089 isoform X2 [Culex pipiens pallens]